MTDLCFLSALELRDLIAQRKVSCREVTSAHLNQIEKVNPRINAIVTLVPELALESADALDKRLSRGEDVGALAGLPVAHKDLVMTAGIRTTYGSRLFADHIPEGNALVVERLHEAGAVTLGKTNTPEWGAGSQTFNDVFGATTNPWDTTRTCGGSSGGAASALAARLIPIADGSDMGGSLRNPASFCNVVGFRVSPGRVPTYPDALAWSPLSVTGPMARTVSDCALLLGAIAGPDSRSPIAIEASGDTFAGTLERDFSNVRITCAPDFGGQLPVDRSVAEIVQASGSIFESLGCRVHDACPDFDGADFIFKTLRAWAFAAKHADNIEKHRNLYKDTIIWNVDEGLKLSGTDVARAELMKTALFHRVREFMADYEFLVLPVSQVPPFDIATEWVGEIEGVAMETYIDWMKSCYYISVLGLPAISVPAGFTSEGLPVGIQIVGRHHADLDVLKLAFAFEKATTHYRQLPDIIDGTAP